MTISRDYCDILPRYLSDCYNYLIEFGQARNQIAAATAPSTDSGCSRSPQRLLSRRILSAYAGLTTDAGSLRSAVLVVVVRAAGR